FLRIVWMIVLFIHRIRRTHLRGPRLAARLTLFATLFALVALFGAGAPVMAQDATLTPAIPTATPEGGILFSANFDDQQLTGFTFNAANVGVDVDDGETVLRLTGNELDGSSGV